MISIQTRRYHETSPGWWVEIDQYFTYADARPSMTQILLELGFRRDIQKLVDQLDPGLPGTPVPEFTISTTYQQIRVLDLEV